MQSAPANAVKSAAIWTGFARFQEEEADADAALPEQHRFFFYRTTPGQKTQARNRFEKTSIISKNAQKIPQTGISARFNMKCFRG